MITYYPTLDEIKPLRHFELAADAAGANYPQARARSPLVPLCCDVLADMETPVSVYCKTARGPFSFLLDSGANGERIARYPLVKALSHLPIISDPSQGTGRRDLVVPTSIASIAAGADGLLIEVHPNPDEALKDGAQSLTLEQFQRLVPQLRSVSAAIGRAVRCSSASRYCDRMTQFHHTMASLLA